jgi:hypothetical protein
MNLPIDCWTVILQALAFNNRVKCATICKDILVALNRHKAYRKLKRFHNIEPSVSILFDGQIHLKRSIMKAAILTNNAYAIRYLYRTQSYEANDTQAILDNVCNDASIKALDIFCDYDPFIWYTKAPIKYSELCPFDGVWKLHYCCMEKIQWALNRGLYFRKIENDHPYILIFTDAWLRMHNEMAQITSTTRDDFIRDVINIGSIPLFHFYMCKMVKICTEPLKINKSQLIHPINPEKHHYLRIANRLGIVQFL